MPDSRADVTSAAEVADVMDVRGVVRADGGDARSALSDGVTFEASACGRAIPSASAPCL